MRAKQELAEYLDGNERDLNAPPSMRGKNAKQADRQDAEPPRDAEDRQG